MTGFTGTVDLINIQRKFLRCIQHYSWILYFNHFLKYSNILLHQSQQTIDTQCYVLFLAYLWLLLLLINKGAKFLQKVQIHLFGLIFQSVLRLQQYPFATESTNNRHTMLYTFLGVFVGLAASNCYLC